MTQSPTGGEVMIEVFRQYGLRTVFCLAGAAHAPLLRDLEQTDFHIIPSRHEASTVAAADGFARVTGLPGVAMIAGHQGMPNALGGIRTAQLACSPVVLLASVSESAEESMGEETNDGLDMVKPFVKWARTVHDANRLEEFLNAAFHQALSGRPGVAVLGIPTHLEGEAVDLAKRIPSRKLPVAAPQPAGEMIAGLADALAKAKRPLILAGTGAALSGAGAALRELAHACDIPVFGHALGRGLVPEDMVHGFPWALSQVAAQKADLVIAVGIRLQQRIGFGMAPRFAEDAVFAQIDIDAGEIGRTRTVELPIQGDAKAGVEMLNAELARRGAPSFGTGWVNDALAERLERVAGLGRDNSRPLHPFAIARTLMDKIPEDTIFVADGADVYNWMSAEMRMRSERCYLDHYPLGSMGIGTPLAIGAAAGARQQAEDSGNARRKVVLVTGDGSFGFYPAEFNSAVIAGLELTCIISNDGNWGTERNALLTRLGTTVNCVIGQCDYHLVAQGFGAVGEKVETAQELADAVDRALAHKGATVLNVITDPDAGEERKTDPRLRMVTFEDLKSSLNAHHSMDLR
ncbi:thiamine pyrophosphate-binding protein [Croceicoccus sp. Ery5]|uniref:thiamine pyrophosphate-binding protein n=1 Tax=Croceicoccus sp. Ery5 TaxID=1703340 RepID=UPI001E510628|nr:thiamine pyrophosphate-binding protein [Croceicoccus sp. Ery5]